MNLLGSYMYTYRQWCIFSCFIKYMKNSQVWCKSNIISIFLKVLSPFLFMFKTISSEFSTVLSFKSDLFPVRPFLEYVDQQVGVSCGHGKTRQQLGHVKLVLRALSNAGVLPSDNFPERCYLVSGKKTAFLPKVRGKATGSWMIIAAPYYL